MRDGVRERQLGLGRAVEGDQHVAVAQHGCILASRYARRAMDDVTLARFAELAVDFGANVQPGQIVSLTGAPGKEPLVRAIAERAYQQGAKFVDVAWFDPWVKRARIEHARRRHARVRPAVVRRADPRARRASAPRAITLSGPVAPGLLDDLDPVRAGRDRLPAIRETRRGRQPPRDSTGRSCPARRRRGRELVHPDLEPDAALAKLEEQLLHVLRLDEADPVAAWRARADTARRPSPSGSPSAASTRCTTRARAPT